ncbi:hypothetical protein [Lyngbya aestuarii]|uniref:hypothetical protein n=1 Tax=Lyngbya aestuarii TaxID=118322 RepID=UPI00403DD5C2
MLGVTPLIERASQVIKPGKFLSLLVVLSLGTVQPARSLPPPEDLPEEVLRMQIITEARSPIDGKPLTAAEYAQLQAKLQERSTAPGIHPAIKNSIFQLRLLQILDRINPF